MKQIEKVLLDIIGLKQFADKLGCTAEQSDYDKLCYEVIKTHRNPIERIKLHAWYEVQKYKEVKVDEK